jgi:hypothetical protein
MSTHRIEVLSGTIPGSLAATAPIVSWLTADAAWVRDDWSGEVRHGVDCFTGGGMSGEQDGRLWPL